MSLEKEQLKIIDLLAKHERLISKLYTEYSQRFPLKRDFWLRVAREEVEHAEWLEKLKSKLEEKKLYFREGRFNEEAIHTSLDYLKGQMVKVQGEGITLKNALSIARDIENGLIEKKFFEVFEPDCQEIKQVFKDLSLATREHYNRIVREWNQETK
ncbi:MAG: hypothetical protein Kow00103_07670 [Candidatus Caldatribacteriota bacterium]